MSRRDSFDFSKKRTTSFTRRKSFDSKGDKNTIDVSQPKQNQTSKNVSIEKNSIKNRDRSRSAARKFQEKN